MNARQATKAQVLLPKSRRRDVGKECGVASNEGCLDERVPDASQSHSYAGEAPRMSDTLSMKFSTRWRSPCKAVDDSWETLAYPACRGTYLIERRD